MTGKDLIYLRPLVVELLPDITLALRRSCYMAWSFRPVSTGMMLES